MYNTEEMPKLSSRFSKETTKPKIADSKPHVAAAAPVPQVIEVTADNGLNVRKAPSTKTEIVRVLKKGEAVDLLGQNPNGWGKISDGWIMLKYTTFSNIE